MTFDIKIPEIGRFLFECFLEKSETKVQSISSENLSFMLNNDSSFRTSKIDTCIEVKILIFLLEKFWKCDYGRDKRDDIF